MDNAVVQVRGLMKSYGNTMALNDLNLEVEKGEIFGIVGPNGAGKTTTIDCMAGMRSLDSGSIRILGLDPVKNGTELKKRTGLQQQESELPDRLKVEEAVNLFKTLFGTSPSTESLLDRVGLLSKRQSCFAALSGGQKRRLFVALALVNDPELIMLDELTSGLDPRGRRKLWQLVEEFNSDERTVILSTHYMDEAEKLCDRVAIFNSGAVVAVDTPAALIRKFCPGIRLRLGCGRAFDPASALSAGGVLKAAMDGEECVMELESGDAVIPVIQEFSRRGISLGNLKTETPTLEDVFMVVTGKEYQDEA